MPKTNIKSLIFKKCRELLEKLPVKERNSMLLSGGGAAFLYGSDRPFSFDYDFEVPRRMSHELRKAFGARFYFHRKKPIFHSLKSEVEIDDTSYDLIAESVIQPPNRREHYMFYLNHEVLKKKKGFSYKGKKIYCIPKELLVLIKLLAGRGKELHKYDLYDVQKILAKHKDFNFRFLQKLIEMFCRPLALSVPLLLKNAKKILAENKSKNIIRLVEDLERIQRSS